eukprot:CAMPEP_0115269968 /NCGR_PEP_ID=MMETSP0270-20121206/53321_1 /TAXON_ID=71861 /ORGANISM="Scrippsiella trochoidea, Strain CCMP3099" /LENGTH=95 /DNA_ID=CAMNT_0002686241 /DNA_START=401 /DNA_END=688 /DNA_ORIENTATION=-
MFRDLHARIAHPIKVVAQDCDEVQCVPICPDEVIRQVVVSMGHVEERHARHLLGESLGVAVQHHEAQMSECGTVTVCVTRVEDRASIVTHAMLLT